MSETTNLRARLQQKAVERKAARKKEAATLLGEDVEVRSLMVGERNRLLDEAFIRKGKGKKIELEPIMEKLAPALLHHCVYEPGTDQQAFASLAAAGAFLDSLPNEDSENIQAVIDTAMEVSGLSKEATREAAKNSEASDD